MNRPEITRSYPVYWIDESTVRIGAQQEVTKQLTDPAGELRVLLPLLDGTRTLEDVVRDARTALPYLTAEQIREGVSLLDSNGILEDAAAYDRLPKRLHANQTFFAAASPNSASPGNFAQEKLRESHVVLFGLGGGGSACLPQLLALGLKKLTIVDADVVGMENLNRQTLYRTSDISRKKVAVAAEYCKSFAPDTVVEGHDTWVDDVDWAVEASGGASCLLCTIDEPPFTAQRRVNAVAVRLGVPAVTLLSQHTRGRMFSVVPGASGCMDCLHIYDEINSNDFLPQFRALMNPSRHAATGVISPHAQRLTSYGVDEVVRLITGYAEPFAVARQMEVDYLSGQIGTVMEWDVEPGCPTCGSADPQYDYIFDVAPL
ncbi:HesA/MoeB/ThiF family protein [Isoptericola sp. NPDC057191]|uniref:HesA/MoeB/ThiF family protein n=1 Tax=Isoptericola sp. NPDC057191 TaxID=3346041 RepID=UPI0036456449